MLMNGVVSGATVVLRCQNPYKEKSTIAGDTGAFEFSNLSLGIFYEIGASANGFQNWASEPIVLNPEHSIFLLTDARMEMDKAAESVTVYASHEERLAQAHQVNAP